MNDTITQAEQNSIQADVPHEDVSTVHRQLNRLQDICSALHDGFDQLESRVADVSRPLVSPPSHEDLPVAVVESNIARSISVAADKLALLHVRMQILVGSIDL